MEFLLAGGVKFLAIRIGLFVFILSAICFSWEKLGNAWDARRQRQNLSGSQFYRSQEYVLHFGKQTNRNLLQAVVALSAGVISVVIMISL